MSGVVSRLSALFVAACLLFTAQVVTAPDWGVRHARVLWAGGATKRPGPTGDPHRRLLTTSRRGGGGQDQAGTICHCCSARPA